MASADQALQELSQIRSFIDAFVSNEADNRYNIEKTVVDIAEDISEMVGLLRTQAGLGAGE